MKSMAHTSSDIPLVESAFCRSASRHGQIEESWESIEYLILSRVPEDEDISGFPSGGT
jgi:hypothetical protein